MNEATENLGAALHELHTQNRRVWGWPRLNNMTRLDDKKEVGQAFRLHDYEDSETLTGQSFNRAVALRFRDVYLALADLPVIMHLNYIWIYLRFGAQILFNYWRDHRADSFVAVLTQPVDESADPIRQWLISVQIIKALSFSVPVATIPHPIIGLIRRSESRDSRLSPARMPGPRTEAANRSSRRCGNFSSASSPGDRTAAGPLFRQWGYGSDNPDLPFY